MSVSQIGLLDKRVASAFYGRFPSLRPVQEEAISPIVNGKNVVLSSGTGSGKTEAVLAPLVSRYLKEIFEEDKPVILYIAPTKALVNDLEKRISAALSNSINVRIGIRHGDRDDLKSGWPPHVLITTPESLEVLLFRRDKNLSQIRAVVLDEVHLLYNTQRGLQLSVLIHRLKNILVNNLQWVAISATIAQLDYIRDFLFGGATEEAVFLEFPSTRTIEAHIRHITDSQSFLKFIQLLIEGHPAKLLIFANDRNSTERLASILQKYEKLKNSVFTHYSSLSPEVRLDIEKKFSSMRSAICIATSTLELGIDIGDIDAVILWGVPGNVESFLQRIGRGNRRSNKTNVICLIPDNSGKPVLDALRFLALVDLAKRGEMPVRSPFNLYGSLVQQSIIQIALENGGFKRISEIFKNYQYFPYMSRKILEDILAELASKQFIRHHGFKNQYGADENLHRLVDYRLIYGNFSAQSQTLEINYYTKNLGNIPSYNLLFLKAGSIFRFAGQHWKVDEISDKKIQVSKPKKIENVINIRYMKMGIGFDPVLTERMWQIIHSNDLSIFDVVETSLREKIVRFQEAMHKICTVNQIPFTFTGGKVCYYTFAGYLVNKAVCLVNNLPNPEIDDISIKLDTAYLGPINWNSLNIDPTSYSSFFDSLFEVTAEQSIYQTMLPEDLQKEEFIQEWLKNDYVPKILGRLAKSEAVSFTGDFL